MNDSFKTLLLSAKNRDTEAVRALFEMYKPLLKSYSAVDGPIHIRFLSETPQDHPASST